MTGLEITAAAIGIAVGVGTLGWGAVAAFRWIAETVAEAVADKATTPIVTALGSLSTEVKNLGTQIEKLWKKSDEGEKLHRDHEAAIAALQEQVNRISPRKRRSRKR